MGILLKAPLWVWPLLVLLIVLGLRSTRPRELSDSSVFVWPSIMTVLSVYSIAATYGAHPLALGGWLLGMIAAILIGRVMPLGVGNARYDEKTGTFYMPGSSLPLVLLLAVFWSRFAIGVAKARFPHVVGTPQFLVSAGLALGLCSGTFAARSLALMSLRSSSRGTGASSAE
jgi:hypothetical protein